MKFAHVSLLLSLLCLMTGCDYFSDEPTAYQVVAMRSPSDVAMAMTLGETSGNAMGQTLILDKKLTWIDGQSHANWESSEVASFPLGRSDPMFGDVYWQPEGSDATIRTVRYLAGSGEIGRVIFVDSQLALISEPAGSPVYILEKALSEEKALALEAALLDRKFSPGPVDGVIDEQTRGALGFYYEYLGLKYRFKTPVISSAILKELIGPIEE